LQRGASRSRLERLGITEIALYDPSPFILEPAELDCRPLQIEPYRLDIFRRAFDTYRSDGIPQYSMVLAGRAKKNHKSSDLVLGGSFSLICRESPQGSETMKTKPPPISI
jgi:hypothetical protein